MPGRNNLPDVNAVLFDFDGVLMKTMEQHLLAWQYAFDRYGVRVNKHDFYLLEGSGVIRVAEQLAEKYGVDPANVNEIINTKIQNFDEIFKPQFYAGVFSLLDFLKSKKIKMAIVTGGVRKKVTELVKDQFNGYFSGIVSGDDVTKTKPFPEPFLKGAELLGLEPQNCIVVENAPHGIRAGIAAGMRVIALETTLGREYLSEANYVVKSFDEILHIFKSNFGFTSTK